MSSSLISKFPNYLTTDSLFQKMVNMGAPWDSGVALSMDISYFSMYSGLKIPSSFVYINSDSEGIVNSMVIAKVLWDLYGKNWAKLWNALNQEYTPIDNYNVDETITRNQSNDRTIGRNTDYTSSVDGTGKEITSDSGETKLQHGHVVDDSRNVNDFTFGFNSAQQVPTHYQTQVGKETNSGTDITTTSSTGELDSTNTSAREDKTAENTIDNNNLNESISRVRKGNIGKTSYQDLLSQEFELWKWNFFYQVFDDVDKFLCLSVFDPCVTIGG